jgi:hypothetical protein
MEPELHEVVCERCGNPTNAVTMSMFNVDIICMGCKDIEAHHPDYPKAAKAEYDACEKGDYNFGGIGKPADL